MRRPCIPHTFLKNRTGQGRRVEPSVPLADTADEREAEAATFRARGAPWLTVAWSAGGGDSAIRNPWYRPARRYSDGRACTQGRADPARSDADSREGGTMSRESGRRSSMIGAFVVAALVLAACAKSSSAG